MAWKDEWRKVSDNRFGWVLFTVTVSLLGVLCCWGWTRFETPLRMIFSDPVSLGTLVGLLLLLYLLLIATRASNERQYALFLIGRFQELVFLRQWKFFVAPAAACISLTMGYYIEAWKVPLTAVSLAGAVVAIYGFVKDVSGVWLRPVEHERYFFLPVRTPRDAGPVRADKEIQPPGTARCLDLWRGRRICLPPERTDWYLEHDFLTSSAVNAALQNDQSALSLRPLERAKEPYALPDTLQCYAETALAHLRAKGGLLHNEPKVRLVSEPFKLLSPDQQGGIAIQQTSYYAGVCSNELTRFVAAPREYPKGGRDLFDTVRRPKTGMLYDFDHSELSNHMGGGTLALTPDGRLLFSKQGRLAAVAAGLLAPAGSGSFDWADQHTAVTFGDLIKKGVERELCEECGLTNGHLARTIVLGMARDLARGGKPDFYAITLLRGSPSTLQPQVHSSEIGLVDHHQSIPLAADSCAELRRQLQDWLTQEQENCSPALMMNLHLLIQASDATLEVLLGHMGRA